MGEEEEGTIYYWQKDTGRAEGYGQPWLPLPAGGGCHQQEGADGLCVETWPHPSIHVNTAELLNADTECHGMHSDKAKPHIPHLVFLKTQNDISKRNININTCNIIVKC